MHPSNDSIPSLAKGHLLGREPCQLSFRGGGEACGGPLSDKLGRLLCKGPLSVFPRNTAGLARDLGTFTATALRLLPRSKALPGEIGAPLATHGEVIRSFAACDQSADRACIAKGPLEQRMTPSTLADRRVRWLIHLGHLKPSRY